MENTTPTTTNIKQHRINNKDMEKQHQNKTKNSTRTLNKQQQKRKINTTTTHNQKHIQNKQQRDGQKHRNHK